MKLIIERAALLSTLAHVQGIVGRNNTIPILSNVLLTASKGTLTFDTTDLDMAVSESAAAVVDATGTTTVSAHLLYDIARKLPDGAQVQLHLKDPGQMIVASGRSRFTVACLPVEDFPAFARGDVSHQFDLPAAHLRRLIDHARFAISTEETRYYLNGIYLHTRRAGEGNKTAVLCAAATDGHRLSRIDAPLPEGAAGMPGVIVPRKAVLELRKLIEGVEGDVAVALSDSKLHFEIGDGLSLTSKVIDGTFPDYERVIPTGNDKTVEVDRDGLFGAADRVSAITSDKSRAIRLVIARAEIVVSATDAAHGSGTEEVEATANGAIDIGFNAKYLMEILAQIEGDKVRMLLADGGSPCILRDPSDAMATYVLMPMRV